MKRRLVALGVIIAIFTGTIFGVTIVEGNNKFDAYGISVYRIYENQKIELCSLIYGWTITVKFKDNMNVESLKFNDENYNYIVDDDGYLSFPIADNYHIWIGYSERGFPIIIEQFEDLVISYDLYSGNGMMSYINSELDIKLVMLDNGPIGNGQCFIWYGILQ
ncbi:MAG: hypothetical protein P1P64_03245 [Treponemataceae bacterium]